MYSIHFLQRGQYILAAKLGLGSLRSQLGHGMVSWGITLRLAIDLIIMINTEANNT